MQTLKVLTLVNKESKIKLFMSKYKIELTLKKTKVKVVLRVLNIINTAKMVILHNKIQVRPKLLTRVKLSHLILLFLLIILELLLNKREEEVMKNKPEIG